MFSSISSLFSFLSYLPCPLVSVSGWVKRTLTTCAFQLIVTFRFLLHFFPLGVRLFWHFRSVLLSILHLHRCAVRVVAQGSVGISSSFSCGSCFPSEMWFSCVLLSSLCFFFSTRSFVNPLQWHMPKHFRTLSALRLASSSDLFCSWISWESSGKVSDTVWGIFFNVFFLVFDGTLLVLKCLVHLTPQWLVLLIKLVVWENAGVAKGQNTGSLTHQPWTCLHK